MIRGSEHPIRRFMIFVAAVLSLLLVAAESDPRPAAEIEPLLHATPMMMRVEVAAGAERTVTIAVTSPTAARVIAATADCRCVSVTTPMPLDLPAGQAVTMQVRVAGVLPGLKTLTIRTTAGTTRVQIQVVTAGMGKGSDSLADALLRARASHAAAWFVVHDLYGEVRNCGCSDGSLGGIDHLAALPEKCHAIAQDVSTKFILSGDSDGQRPGVGAALSPYGWKTDEAAIIITSKPESAVTRAGVVAVIPTVPVSMENARLVRPVLNSGMIAEVLLVTADGRIGGRFQVPIDASLPSKPEILTGFQDQLTAVIDDKSEPSTSCMSCHRAAHDAWSKSVHARAWLSLKESDRTDGCVSCHSLLAAPKVLVPGVQCASCHRGAEAHASSRGTMHTTGTTDCRSCHDAQHHPAFDPVAAWVLIAHGK
jgi:hypothetical protein